MRRKFYNELLEWKKKAHKKHALLIDGARRVGKSYVVEEFAKNEYKTYILIDFFKARQEIKDLFENYLDDLDNLFLHLEGYYNVKLIPQKSLIIFDEVQFCPRARAAIKYLVADGRFDYIETGSLVSIKENTGDIIIPSEERHLNMHPMDFEEFLWAIGNETLVPLIKNQFEKLQPMGQALHRKAMDYFRQYMIVGGMPQAVLEYSETRDFIEVDKIKRDILNLYRDDIRKYAKGAELKAETIFDEIPGQLSKHEKKFVLSSLEKNARLRDYSDAFMWLCDAMVVNHCYNVTDPAIGLSLNSERTTLKCYMADTGLLISHSFDEKGIVTQEVYKKILLDKLEFNGGMIIENIAAQMLRATNHKLYFYSNSSRKNAADRMEIDFLIAKSKITSRHNISPIEVKSSQRYTLSSIKKFMSKYKEQTNTPFVLHTGDLKVQDGIVFLPIYMAMFL